MIGAIHIRRDRTDLTDSLKVDLSKRTFRPLLHFTIRTLYSPNNQKEMKYTKFVTKIRVGIWWKLHDMLEKGGTGFGWAAANRGGLVVVSVVVVWALQQGGHASFLRPSWWGRRCRWYRRSIADTIAAVVSIVASVVLLMPSWHCCCASGNAGDSIASSSSCQWWCCRCQRGGVGVVGVVESHTITAVTASSCQWSRCCRFHCGVAVVVLSMPSRGRRHVLRWSCCWCHRGGVVVVVADTVASAVEESWSRWYH